jgi:dipeptidyl aminopeptidase/acylaminoacyl peptidase
VKLDAMPTTRRRLPTLVVALAVAFGSAYALPSAQSGSGTTAAVPAATKKALTVDDYTRWRSISGDAISADGRWVTYGYQFTNVPQADAKPVLHVKNLESGQDVEVPNATGGTFSDDSQWIAYIVDPTGGRGGRGGRGRAGGGQTAQAGRGGDTPPAEPRRAELRHLATGAVKSWQDIASFEFSPASTHLMLRRRPPQPAGGGGRGAGGGGGAQAAPAGGGDEPAGPRGVGVIVHNLTTGLDLPLGNVGDIAFNKAGDLLAYTVDAAPKDGNGLFVLEPGTGRMHTLDSDAKTYNRLAWNEAGTALAVLKGVEVEKMRERANVLLAFPDLRASLAESKAAPAIFDPATATGFPDGWVMSDRAALEWSQDGQRVFFGAKPQVAAPEPNQRREADEVADVDVWNTLDERVQSQQMRQADADRNRTYRQAFNLATGQYVRLADETLRDLDVADEGRWAVGRDVRGYIHDFQRPAADFHRVDTATGDRTLMFKGQLTGAHVFGLSPDGRHFLYWKDSKVQAYDLDAGTSRTLGGNARVDFTDMEFDRPGPRPAYGVAGYTADGTAVVVEHRYDLWEVPLDGSAARNLTKGAGSKDEIRLRYVRTEPDDRPGGGGGRGGRGGGAPQKIDLSKPITLSAYGQWTKKAGFYELANGQLTPLVYEDAAFSNPSRAKQAEKFVFTRQTFVEFPDLRVSGPGFTDATKVTDANPHQAEFQWGRRVLFDYTNRDGVRLQGILALPDDYQPGEKRPMIVTFYEKNSQNLNRYSSPSYLTGMGSSPVQAVSEGYITMLPDIHFRTGSSHTDMLECVEAAVKKVIEMGYADPARIGLNGHSYGGEGAAFIGVRSKLFAAVGMGAGVTDLTADFNQSWGWSYQVNGGSGANGHDYYLFGQGRWGFAPWDNPEIYRFESAITHVKDAIPPFLIMHGTADPTVSFSEGLNFFNALRYYGKQAVLLAYPGEPHGLRGMANRKDLTIRFLQFFNHYLKGEPAPKWMTEGVPFLEKDAKRDPRGGTD